MKSCSEFQKGGIYFLMELDLALLLISVFTVTSCDMCLSVVFIFEVSMLCFWKKNLKVLPNWVFIFWKSNVVKDKIQIASKFRKRLPLKNKYCGLSVGGPGWFLKHWNFGLDRGDPQLCVSILLGPVPTFQIDQWKQSKLIK